MNHGLAAVLLYATPLLLGLALYLRSRRRRHAAHAEKLREMVAAGLTEPASLHPTVDPNQCITSGSCIKSCPEQALGIIDGKARLVNPTVCIGHGACKSSCPMDAITLVFGTERRGVDIPYVKPNFETNVPGLFIAGELGGMGLVRKAAEQGRQAMESIAGLAGGGEAPLDVVIVGAGPAGLAATLAARQHKLRHVTIEQEDSLGGTINHYPRNKIVMTAPIDLPIVGKVRMSEISKEALLDFWQDVIDRSGVKINFNERMEKLAQDGDGFAVTTTRGTYHARSVLLAIGRRGTPRKLGVPGEEQPKVVYRLVDPGQYRGQHVLVVGGGDSALEAALAVAEEPGTRVTLSYRGDAFGRVKAKNRTRLEEAQSLGRIDVRLNSNVQRIGPKTVQLEQEGATASLDNDAVIVCAGGILPTPMLKEIGILVETKYGTA